MMPVGAKRRHGYCSVTGRGLRGASRLRQSNTGRELLLGLGLQRARAKPFPCAPNASNLPSTRPARSPSTPATTSPGAGLSPSVNHRGPQFCLSLAQHGHRRPRTTARWSGSPARCHDSRFSGRLIPAAPERPALTPGARRSRPIAGRSRSCGLRHRNRGETPEPGDGPRGAPEAAGRISGGRCGSSRSCASARRR